MSIEAMKQALEALDYAWGYGSPRADEKITRAMAELRQVIATEESSAVQKPYGFLKLTNGKFFHEVEGCNPMTDKAYLPLYTHPQPKAEQEPVAWRWGVPKLKNGTFEWRYSLNKTREDAIPLYTKEQL